jgi:multisubunit Na+/H+ antiporter MnhG subunit
MIKEELKNIKEEKKDLRKFGLTVGAVLLIIGIILYLTGKTLFLIFGGAGTLLILLAFIYPKALKPANKLWMMLAILMGWFMSRVILAILFYLVVTPTALLLKIIGKDFLKLRADKSVKSYWEKRDNKIAEKLDYERQF